MMRIYSDKRQGRERFDKYSCRCYNTKMTNYCGGPNMYGGMALNRRWHGVCGRMMMQGGIMCELAGKKVCEKDPS